jgi:YidC/Oxa1 family membrane protein insertase
MLQQDPEGQKNLMLAIGLSVAVLLLWQVFYGMPKMKEEQERNKRLKEAQAIEQQAKPGDGVAAGATPQPGGVRTSAGAAAGGGLGPVLTRTAALEASPRVAIETDKVRGSINLKGALLDDLVLPKYRETTSPSSAPVAIMSPVNSELPFFAEQGWAAATGIATKVPTRDTVWTAPAGAKLTTATPLILTYDNGAGLIFRRTIAIDQHYMFSFTDEVENTSSAEVKLFPFGRLFRENMPKIEGLVQHEGLISVVGKENLTELTYATAQVPTSQKLVENAVGGWLGFTDKYWAYVFIPDQARPFTSKMWSPSKKSPIAHDTFQADYIYDAAVSVAAGAKQAVTTRLFAGAKEVEVIKEYQRMLDIRLFDFVVDWGWFWFITKPLYTLLTWLHQALGNFGLAILSITVIMKAIFFWPTQKSMESMAKMKKLQPEMEKLKARYPDDKAKQQQELMALYAKEKINPLMGCLPMLIQAPVFFAVYKVIFIAIDMRHAPFFGWIKDLSAADPTSFTNLFGLMPWPALDNLMLGYTFGAWAIIMGITMWVQMQLNPQQPDPTQQAVFNWMPVMFTFMMGSFASGLVIYWAWSNVLGVAQQYFIMKRMGVDVPLADNLKKTGVAAVALVRSGIAAVKKKISGTAA